jgi:hypothetical protein
VDNGVFTFIVAKGERVAIDKIVIRTRAAIARDQNGKLHQIQELTTFVRRPDSQDAAGEWDAASKSLAMGHQPLLARTDGSLKATGSTGKVLTVVRWGRELEPDELRELPRQMTYSEILGTRTHKFEGLSIADRVLRTLKDGPGDAEDRSLVMLSRLAAHLSKIGGLPDGDLDTLLLDVAQ